MIYHAQIVLFRMFRFPDKISKTVRGGMEYPVLFPGQYMAGGTLRREGDKAEVFAAANLKAASGADHTAQPCLYQKSGIVNEVMAGKHI